MTNFETPMGNTELRLTLQNLESEIAEVKRISIDTNTQANKTNGRVNWLMKIAWVSIGALPVLTFMAVFQWYTIFGNPQHTVENPLAAKSNP